MPSKYCQSLDWSGLVVRGPTVYNAGRGSVLTLPPKLRHSKLNGELHSLFAIVSYNFRSITTVLSIDVAVPTPRQTISTPFCRLVVCSSIRFPSAMHFGM